MSAQPVWTRSGARVVCGAILLSASLIGMARAVTLAPPAPPQIPVSTGVDVNDADASELSLLPGIGPALSGEIVREREIGGRFTDLDDLERVRGIGERRVMALRGHAVVRARAGG